MPRVPVYDSPMVSPNTLSPAGVSLPQFDTPEFRTVQPSTFKDTATPEIERLSDSLGRTGSAVGRIADDLVQRANTTRVDDAMTQLVKADTDLRVQALQIRGRNAIERPDGKALPDEYAEKLHTVSQGIQDALGNDAQKAAFQQQAGRLQANLYGAVSMHVAKEWDTYQDEADNAKIDAATQRASAIPNDDNTFNQSLGAIENVVRTKVQRKGGNQEMADAEFLKLRDATYYSRYKAWEQSDPVAALASFQRNQSKISPLMRDRIADDLFRTSAPLLAQAAKSWVAGAGAAPAGQPELAKEPRGIRNNNPGNIRQSATPWQGEVSGSDPAYATFASPEAGIRAMGKNLLAYQDAYGLNTVSGIVSRWAPATENNTASYVMTVSKAMGVKPDDKLNLHDPDTMGKMVRAMIQVENGKQPYGDAQINAGVNAALGNGALPAGADRPATATASEPTWRDPNAVTGNPVIDSLPPNQRAQVYNLAHTQLRQDTAQARDALTSRINDASAEYMATGKAANPPSQADFIQAYGQLDGVQRYQAFQDVATLGQRLQETKTLSNTDLVAMVNNAKPTPGDGFAQRQHNYEILQKAAQQTLDNRKADPIKSALQNPAFGIQPLKDFGDLNAVMTEIGKRKGVMDKISTDYGTPPTLLTNDEASKFGAFLAAQQPQDKARILGDFAAIGGEAGARSLSMQLKDKNNTLAIAATLAAYTTAPTTHWFGPDTPGTNVGQMYLEGKDAIEQKRAKIDAQAEFGTKAEIYKAIDGVYQTPQGRDTAAEAAYGIYAKLKADGDDDVDRAVKLATGGIMEFNGGKIAKPWGWDDDRFKDAIATTLPKEITDAGGEFVAAGHKINADQLAKTLPGSRLQTYGQGTYLVMVGNDVVRNLDGTPYILKADQ